MKKILLGASALSFADSIRSKTGLECVILPPFEKISPSVSSHADSLVFAHGNTVITYSEYYRLHGKLFDSLGMDIELTDEFCSDKYPYDILLNALVLNGCVIGKCKYLSDAVKKDKREINVAQGYARCSTLLLGSDAAITADTTIHKALTSLSLDVLLIGCGNILLEGCDYGFIGGASFVYENTVYFFGNHNRLPDGEKINDHLEKHGYSAVLLKDVPLTDCGGAIIL